jgi:hypothetical protein
MKNEMLTVAEASARIETGAVMAIAGAEELLRVLPHGRWIGGTTVYFVTEAGGAVVRDKLFCTTFEVAVDASPRYVGLAEMPELAKGYHPNGFTMIMIPAFSVAHSNFAVDGQEYPGLFDQPLLGWVTGVHLDEVGKRAPMVFDGLTGIGYDEGAALLHVALPEDKHVDLDILNIFAQGDAEEHRFVFDESGFTARTATVGGKKVDFAAYVAEKTIDTRLPLVANYAGALVNVSIQSVDAESGEVKFYAPVVAGVEYRLAGALGNYAEAFAEGATGKGAGQYSCNCILNYLYGDLEGKKTGEFTGPVTFGEIAYILLNQTLVRMDIETAA